MIKTDFFSIKHKKLAALFYFNKNIWHRNSVFLYCIFSSNFPLPKPKTSHKAHSDLSHHPAFFCLIASFSRSSRPAHLPLFSHCQSCRCSTNTHRTEAHTHIKKQTHQEPFAANWGVQIAHLDCCIILSVFTFHFLLSFQLVYCALFVHLLLPPLSGVCVYFLSSLSCLLSSFHPSLISLPSSRTCWPPT